QTGSTRLGWYHNAEWPAFWPVTGRFVGLAGLEPAASSLSGMSAGCVLAGRARDNQPIGSARLTVAVRWGPGLTLRCGTRMARPVRRGTAKRSIPPGSTPAPHVDWLLSSRLAGQGPVS